MNSIIDIDCTGLAGIHQDLFSASRIVHENIISIVIVMALLTF